MRQNANSIHKESVFYQSTFPNLCGKVLPSLPNPSTDGLPVYKQSEDEGHGGESSSRAVFFVEFPFGGGSFALPIVF